MKKTWTLRSHGIVPKNESSEGLRALFLKSFSQPANNDLPEQPEFLVGEKLTLRSFVLGCELTVQAANNEVSTYLAETILGILEALLATSLESDLVPFRSELKIVISPSDFVQGPPQYAIDEVDINQTITIRHAQSAQPRSTEDQKVFGLWLLKFVLDTTLTIAIITDAKAFTRRIMRDESGFARAMSLSEVEVAVRNILGRSPKFRLSDWEEHATGNRFPVQRDLPWNYGFAHQSEETSPEGPLQIGEGEPPEELFGIDSLRHKDRRVLSLINVPLWDKAGWCGTAYLWRPDATPVLSLGFRKPEIGKRIFDELRAKLGEIDEAERLRIVIITGVDRKRPYSYRVVVSINRDLLKTPEGKHLVFVARINQMDPSNLHNLNSFLEHYNRMRRYFVVPSHFKAPAEEPEIFWDRRIGKRELFTREAWQLSENDPDSCALREGDQPVVPAGVEDAPVNRALARLKQLRRRKAKHRK